MIQIIHVWQSIWTGTIRLPFSCSRKFRNLHSRSSRTCRSTHHRNIWVFSTVNGADTVLETIDTAFQEAALRLTDPTDASESGDFCWDTAWVFYRRLYCAKSDANVAGDIFSGTSSANPMSASDFAAGIVYNLRRVVRSNCSKQCHLRQLKANPDARTPFDADPGSGDR